jgi:glycosyltransferase involved in cell wall biosynthesis
MFVNNFRKSNKLHKLSSKSADVPNRSWRLGIGKIMVIGMADSPHFQKWLKTLCQEFPDRKIFIFPSDRPRSKLKNFESIDLIGRKSTRFFRLTPIVNLNFVLYYVLDNLIGSRWRSYLLALYIFRHKPKFIHFHEMQHGAYLFNQIFNYKRIAYKSRKIISTWGSDLSLYSWSNEHHNQIKTCLSWADILTAEREEELNDAERLGFKGEFRAPLYITIGQNPTFSNEQTKPSSRNTILLKGHQSDTGRALNALEAISQISSQLSDFKILVYSAPNSVQIQVDTLRNKHKINIEAIPKIRHNEMCNLFYQARLSISLSVSDGLPGVLVEAMQAGAFPIQSSNSAGKDFITHGTNGFLVEPWDIESIKECILTAVSNDILVDHASELNQQILAEKYSLKDGIQKLRKLYL